MTPEPKAPDHAERVAALDPARSFIVQAPAGSGKTELLIRRILKVLPTLTAPEELIAITFTRKAAAEMRQRLFAALESGARPEPAEGSAHARDTWALARAALEHDGRQGWGLLDNPSRLRLQTIDALCASLCRRMPLAGAAGAAWAATDDTAGLFREAARRALRMLTEKSRWQAPLQRLLAHLDNDLGAVEQLLVRMLESRERWLRHVADPAAPHLEREALEASLRGMIEDHLHRLRDAFPAPLSSELLLLARYAGGCLREAGEGDGIAQLADIMEIPAASVAGQSVWLAIADFLLTDKGSLRAGAGLTKRIGFPAASRNPRETLAKSMKERMAALLETLGGHAEFVDALRGVRALPPPVYSEAQWSALDALIQLLPVVAAQLMVVFGERAQVDHAAVMRAALDALGPEGQPTDLALALDHRIRHILVDEFQDTSHGQFQLLERLTAGWQEGDGRTLFLVGDPMQSIYRFREADVGLFLQARHRGIGTVMLNSITLRANFRAQAGLVQWLNERVAGLFPDRDDVETGAVSYTPCNAVLPAGMVAPVTVHIVPDNDRHSEAREVVRLIREALRADPDGSVAVLVSGRSHLSAILPALRQSDIPLSAVEIDPLGERAVVRDLLALTRALLHPADRIAWLSVLRAPWCGLGLGDLEAVARVSDGEARSLAQVIGEDRWRDVLSEDGRQRLARVAGILQRALANRQRLSVQRSVESAWLALGGPAVVEAVHDLADAQTYFTLLASLESSSGAVDLARLAERIDKLYAQPTAMGAGAVQVMTMHGAKGLEFDTVILAGLGNRPAPDKPQLLRWLERTRGNGRTDLLLASLGVDRSSSDAVYQALGSVERRRDLNEECRLLYVAVTRARRSLHLLGTTATDQEGLPAAPASASLLARLWGAVQGQYRRVESDAVASRTTDSAAGQSGRRSRIAIDWQAPSAAPAVGTAVEMPQRKDTGDIEFSWASHTARVVGVVVHRALQRMAEQGAQARERAVAEQLPAVLLAQLRAQGVAEPDVEEASASALRAVRNVLRDPRGLWLLRPHAQARSELRMTALLDGQAATVAMDRTFVDEAGVRWVVDFKTSVHEGSGLEAFLDSEQTRYQEQMSRYARVLRLSGETRPIRLGLYFPLLQAWREWAATC